MGGSPNRLERAVKIRVVPPLLQVWSKINVTQAKRLRAQRLQASKPRPPRPSNHIQVPGSDATF